MKGYGLPRNICVAYPDCADGVCYALKSSKLRLRGKGGDYKSSMRSSEAKRANRRFYKKQARRAVKSELARCRRMGDYYIILKFNWKMQILPC